MAAKRMIVFKNISVFIDNIVVYTMKYDYMGIIFMIINSYNYDQYIKSMTTNVVIVWDLHDLSF